MKNSYINGNGNTTFGIVLFAILLLIIFFCFFGSFWYKSYQAERFDNGCQLQNFNNPNFLNQRFFHNNNIDKLVATDPVHVERNVVQSALFNEQDMNDYFGSTKKKSL